MDDDGKFYVGANYAAFNYKEGSVDLDLPVIYGRIGAFMTDNLSAEFRYGVAAGDDSVDLGGVSGDVEVSEYYGLYLRAGAPVTKSIYPYVFAGLTKGELEISAMGVTVSDEDDDTSYGLGVDFSIPNSAAAVNLEYGKYMDKDGFELDGFTVGVSCRF